MTYTPERAAAAQFALEKAAQIVIEHGSPERAERLQASWGAAAGGYGLGNDQLRRDMLFAELFAGLAEAVESLSARVAELEEKASERWAQPSSTKARMK